MSATPLEKAVETAQAALTRPDTAAYDVQSWVIFVGNQMQRILDAAEPERCPERCGGIVGHSGHHQTTDYDEIKAEAYAKGFADMKSACHDEKTEARVDALDVEALARAIELLADKNRVPLTSDDAADLAREHYAILAEQKS